MKLLSIKLCNFRQFYGKTPEINLASGEQNTTIIHGNNGSGKTTILNGFTWVLYEKFTAAFSTPEFLINKRAITEAQIGTSVECWVEVFFEHESKRYHVKRKCYACQDKDGKMSYSHSELFMLISRDDGRWYHSLQPPEEVINNILPESLHQYFFFDGEHIEHIFRSSDKSKIAEDTKELIGVTVLIRAIEHLKKAKKTLHDELKEIGESDIKKLLKQQTQLEKSEEVIKQKIQEIIQQINQQEELKKILSQRLLDLSGAAELNQLKEKLENQEKKLRQSLTQAKDRINYLISSRGYIIFLADINAKFYDLIDGLRQRGELPSGIKQQFVQQLLDRKQCICGSELTEGSATYQQVKHWMDKAGIADVEEAAIRLESQVNDLEKQAQEFWQEVDQHQANINQWRSELSQVENELDKIKDKFRHDPDEDIKNLQKRLDEVEDYLKEVILEQGANQHQIEGIEKEIDALSKQVQKHKIREEKQELVQRRIKATQEAIEIINNVKTRLEKQFRQSLEKRVQEIFSFISFTPYIPRISQDYELKLIENTSGIAAPVAASTGENQILSLSFIGGIIDQVRKWSEKNTLMGPDSSTFPIVMDSPFGSLDEKYRTQVAKSIPELANQLIVLVTKTQWRGEVESEIANYIGKQYVLVYYSPKQDCEEDFITLDGVNYPLVKPSPNKFEYTEIMEVEPSF